MVPVNKQKNGGCTPVSSNCVVWQGPDIPCINLCSGDTITDVVYKLATELCKLIDMFDLQHYDLTCLNLGCPTPENFKDLINILIQKICEQQGNATPGIASTGGGCPDNCVVPIAECFYYTNNLGDQVRFLSITDYVNLIGNRVCDIVSDITQIQLAIQQLDIRVTVLENTPAPTFTLPSFTPDCVITPAVPTTIDIILEALETQFCELRTSTGLPADIFSAIAVQCPNLNNSPALAPGLGNMSSLPGWVNTVTNLSDSVTNMWLTICDLRAAVQNIKVNCCPDGCEDLQIVLQALVVSGELRLYFTGTIPAGFVECAGSSTFTILDTAGNLYNAVVSIPSLINSTYFGITIASTPLNPLLDFTITSTTCFNNTSIGQTCFQVLSDTVNNTIPCPVVTLTPTASTIGWSFSHPGGTATYNVELWDGGSPGSLISTYVQAAGASPAVYTGTFSGLTSSTTYRVRLRIVVGSEEQECSYNITSTLSDLCEAPDTVTAILTY